MIANYERPDLDKRPISGSSCHAALSTPVIDIVPTPYLQRSDLLDRLLGMLLLVVAAPVIGLLILLVRLSSRGPGLYRQVRVGAHGRIFVMYKIRSMVNGAEESTGPVWTHDNSDPRITWVGRFLRASHLDELPQLINVVRGEMSLFGPRPERPELVHILADNIPGYLNRLAVRPGITGLAQINLPPDSDIECVRRKLQLDLEYIKHATSTLDVQMFFWTCLRLIGVSASVATRTMNVGRTVSSVPRNVLGPSTIENLSMTNGRTTLRNVLQLRNEVRSQHQGANRRVTATGAHVPLTDRAIDGSISYPPTRHVDR